MRLVIHNDGMVRSLERGEPLGSGIRPYIHFPSVRYIRTYGSQRGDCTRWDKGSTNNADRP